MLKKDIKRNKLSCKIMTGSFIAFLAFFTVGTLISPDRAFSETENRTLAQKPQLTSEKVFSGEFGTAAEDYMADQILLKDELMSVKTTTDYLLGKSYQNGVYFSKDGYLLQRFTEDRANLDKNLAAISEFAVTQAAAGRTVDMMLVPNSVCINSDKLPNGAVTDDQRETIAHVRETLPQSVRLFDPTEQLTALQTGGVQCYYRTDHHWTSPAAKYAAECWLASMGLPCPADTYTYNEVPAFYGTLWSKAPAGFIRPDRFGYYTSTAGKYLVEYVAEGKSCNSLTDSSFLEKKDKYASFFGGNFAHMVIRSNAPVQNGKLLVLKDSYANAALPFLADVFPEIHVIDLRYFHTETVSSVLDANGISRVMMLYNVDFLNEDRNFVWLG